MFSARASVKGRVFHSGDGRMAGRERNPKIGFTYPPEIGFTKPWIGFTKPWIGWYEDRKTFNIGCPVARYEASNLWGPIIICSAYFALLTMRAVFCFSRPSLKGSHCKLTFEYFHVVRFLWNVSFFFFASVEYFHVVHLLLCKACFRLSLCLKACQLWADSPLKSC